MVIECPIHKVAKTDRISDNECQSCELFYDCPTWVFDDLENKMIESTASAVNKIKNIIEKKYIGEIRETIKGHTVKKRKEGVGKKY